MLSIALDGKSFLATAFLISSLYVFYRSGSGSIEAALLELGLVFAIGLGLYFSYRLIQVINRTLV